MDGWEVLAPASTAVYYLGFRFQHNRQKQPGDRKVGDFQVLVPTSVRQEINTAVVVMDVLRAILCGWFGHVDTYLILNPFPGKRTPRPLLSTSDRALP